MTEVPGYVDAGWLALRGPADVHARDTFAGHLTARLADHLARRAACSGAVVRLLDVGAGTGAGAWWLEARLPFDLDWRLVDHDPGILAAGRPGHLARARGVVAAVDDVPDLLAGEPADVVTCQALLDILTAAEVDALLSAAAASNAAVLLGLSVTGEVTLDPPHPDDALVAAAFDAHQRRDGRLGPAAGACAVEKLRRLGYAVTVADTPWQLGPADSALTLAWLRGRVAAAQEEALDVAERLTSWHRERERQVTDGALHAVVGHVDVLGLPG